MSANRPFPGQGQAQSRSTEITCSLKSAPPSCLGQITPVEVEATLKSFDSNAGQLLLVSRAPLAFPAAPRRAPRYCLSSCHHFCTSLCFRWVLDLRGVQGGVGAVGRARFSTHFIAFAGAPNTPLAAAIPISQCIEFVFAQRDAIQGVFQQLDVGCDGRIGESDLQIARERLNLKLSDADIKRLITIADSDESGGVVRFPRVLRRSCSRTDPCSPPLTAL
jgi:hypothetical protein